VLTIGEKPVKAIVGEQLNVWDARARAGKAGKQGLTNGRTSSSHSSKS
jgi:hypothetical protein